LVWTELLAINITNEFFFCRWIKSINDQASICKLVHLLPISAQSYYINAIHQPPSLLNISSRASDGTQKKEDKNNIGLTITTTIQAKKEVR
jgi:hypothetical protein